MQLHHVRLLPWQRYVIIALLVVFLGMNLMPAGALEPKIQPQATSTITFRYFDDVGRTIAPDKTYTAEEGTPFSFSNRLPTGDPAIPDIANYRYPKPSSAVTTFSASPQTIDIVYERRFYIPSGLSAFHLETATTQTTFDYYYGDYPGNCVFYPDVPADYITVFNVMYYYQANYNGFTTMAIHLPEGHKLTPTDIPVPQVYYGSQGGYYPEDMDPATRLSAQGVSDLGLRLAVLYSVDGGITYSASVPNLAQVNALEFELMCTDRTLITEDLWVMTPAHLKLNQENLSSEELSGDSRISGFTFDWVNGDTTGNIPWQLTCASPTLGGTVKMQEVKEESDYDWATATGLAGQLVELLDENGAAIASTNTAADGSYLFSHIDSFGPLSVRIAREDGSFAYYDQASGTYSAQNPVLMGTIDDVDRLTNAYPAPDGKSYLSVNWKREASPDAKNGADFIVAALLQDEDPSDPTTTTPPPADPTTPTPPANPTTPPTPASGGGTTQGNLGARDGSPSSGDGGVYFALALLLMAVAGMTIMRLRSRKA